MRIGVITFPGSLDERDTRRAIEIAGGEPVALWHADQDLQGVDAVILPGGFSYGNYLRPGAIASRAPIIAAVTAAAAQGLPVLGIGNGFQILLEARLLPGALVRNETGAFVSRDQRLRIENVKTAWTGAFSPGTEIILPVKTVEGNYLADAETLAMLEAEGRIVLRYSQGNPTGSSNDIAGVSSGRGNVVGLLPHPEHAVEEGFGPDTEAAMRNGTDGYRFFQSVLDRMVSA